MSSFSSILNQLVNNANTVTLTHIANTLLIVSVVPLAICLLLDFIHANEDMKGGVGKLRFGLSVVAAILALFSLILFSTVCFINKSRTMPGYKEPADGVIWVDNNGVFGNGYGGVGEATEVQPPVTVVDKDGIIRPISGETGNEQFGIDSANTSILDGVTVGRNDDLGPGQQEIASLPSSLEH